MEEVFFLLPNGGLGQVAVNLSAGRGGCSSGLEQEEVTLFARRTGAAVSNRDGYWIGEADKGVDVCLDCCSFFGGAPV